MLTWKTAFLATWALLLIGIVAYLYFSRRGRAIRSWFWFGKEVMLGGTLHTSINQIFEELAERNVQRETTANVLKHILHRLTRIGLFAIAAAIIPVLFLVIQSWLLGTQNNLLRNQNQRIEQQTNLLEAQRRSSLVFLMSNILDKVDDEIKEQQKALKEQGFDQTAIDTSYYKLSNPLINRIVALSRSLGPYRSMEGDTLSPPKSPERGQLFIAVMANRLDSATQNRIVAEGDFSNAVIGQIDLGGAKLRHAVLRDAVLRDAVLRDADLSDADLSEAYLRNAYLREADLRDATGLSLDQLLTTYSLWKTMGVDSTLRQQLQQQRPCLFTKDGCPYE